MPLRRILSGCAALIVAAVLAAAALSAAAARTPLPLSGPVADGGWTARTRGWFTARGFYGAESDAPPSDGTPPRVFSWTGPHAELLASAIDRRTPYRVSVRVAAGRGPGVAPPPAMTISIDGRPREQVQTTNEARTFEVEAPVSGQPTMRIALDLSNTFTPGPGDARSLGVMIEDVSLSPLTGGFHPLRPVLWKTAGATAGYVAAALLCGVAVWAALGTGVVVALAHAWLLALDGAFMSTLPDRLLMLGAGVAILGALAAGIRAVWRMRSWGPEWAIALACALVSGGMKLAFFMHPRATIGDAIFQVHRAQAVAGGSYFFTSITPRPFFEFPYAIALYVNAMPLWRSVPAELDRVLLLRGLAIAADALVGVAMYAALRHAFKSRWVALAFAVLWPFARVSMQALCTANLTNLYGQGVFGIAMGVLGWLAVNGSISLAGLAAVTGLLAIAFLSHFSTISVGIPLVGLVALLLATVGQGSERRLGRWLLVCLVVAAGVSYVVYYSHFTEVYAKTLSRVASREGEAEARSMVAPIAVKARRWLTETTTNFGWPLMIAALAGAGWLAKREPRNGFTIVLIGWAAAWVVFSLLGIFTAIEMRFNLATGPLAFALAAFALGSLGQSSRLGAALAVMGAGAIAWDGVADWMMCLTGHR